MPPNNDAADEGRQRCRLAAELSVIRALRLFRQRARIASMGHPVVNLDDLSPEEQLELLGELWDRLSQRPASVPLTPEQRQELDRRLDELEENIRAGRPLGRPWSEVREQLRSK